MMQSTHAFVAIGILSGCLFGGCRAFSKLDRPEELGIGGRAGLPAEFGAACESAQFISEDIVEPGLISLEGSGEGTLGRDCETNGDAPVDGFLALNMSANSRLYAEVIPGADDQDVAVGFTASCASSLCGPGANRCGAGMPEYVVARSSLAQTYRLGVETNTTEVPVAVRVLRPVCGNGEVDAGETCDDDNTVSGDGCDDSCRVELSDAEISEVEPNDFSLQANLLKTAEINDSRKLSGRLSSSCDVDRYAFELTVPSSIRIIMADTESLPCTEAPSGLRVGLLSSDGARIATGRTQDLGGACPVLDERDIEAGVLQPGSYDLVVDRSDASEIPIESSEEVFDYSMSIDIREVVEAAPAS